MRRRRRSFGRRRRRSFGRRRRRSRMSRFLPMRQRVGRRK